jgi:hypothetical protein
MIVRFFKGLLLGAVIGLAAAAFMVGSSGALFYSRSQAYLACAVVGAITGLVAGKPIWSADGKVEALVKAAFGAIGGLGFFFVAHLLGRMIVDLTMIRAGFGPASRLPAVVLPSLAVLLSVIFELDNTAGSKSNSASAGAFGSAPTRVASGARVGASPMGRGGSLGEARGDRDEEGMAESSGSRTRR